MALREMVWIGASGFDSRNSEICSGGRSRRPIRDEGTARGKDDHVVTTRGGKT